MLGLFLGERPGLGGRGGLAGGCTFLNCQQRAPGGCRSSRGHLEKTREKGLSLGHTASQSQASWRLTSSRKSLGASSHSPVHPHPTEHRVDS